MAVLTIRGDALASASRALGDATTAFAGAAVISTGADYGSASVEAAAAQFASVLHAVLQSTGEQTAAHSASASATRTAFASLDSALAVSASARLT